MDTAVIIPLYATAAAFLYWMGASLLLQGASVRMDILDPSLPNGGRFTFHQFFVIYRRLAYVVFAVDMALAVAVTLIKGLMTSRPFEVAGSLVNYSLSAVAALLFIVWLTVRYESYQHCERYRGWQYALTWTLGGYSLVTFILGLLATVLQILRWR